MRPGGENPAWLMLLNVSVLIGNCPHNYRFLPGALKVRGEFLCFSGSKLRVRDQL